MGRMDLSILNAFPKLWPEKVADEQHSFGPQPPADHVPEQEPAGGHAERASHRVEKGPDDRDEPGDDDGLALAVALEMLFGALQVLGTEKPRVRPRKEPWARLHPDVVAELGSGDGGNRRPDEKRGEGQVITAGERGHRQHASS